MSKTRKISHQPPRNGYKKRGKPSSEDRAITRQKKCYHLLKLLQKALKKARQFEVGKLKRRAKAAEGQPARDKLAAQLAALDELDLDAAAQQAAIRGGITPEAVPVLGSPTAAAGSMPSALTGTVPQSAASVLLPRLLSAKTVREEIASAQKALAALDAAGNAADARQQQRQARDEKKKQQQQQHKARDVVQSSARAASTDSGASDDMAGGDRRRQMDDFGNLDDEASASDIDTGTDTDRDTKQKQQSPAEGQPNGDITRRPPAKPKQPKKPKNRLGQRARRQQAVREFGAQANHLPPRPTSILRPDSQHGSSGGGHRQRVMPHGKDAPSRGGDGGSSGCGGEDEEAIHPSWAAKAKAKQLAAAKPAGTKMVFGDDGEVSAVKSATPLQEATQKPQQPSRMSVVKPGRARGPIRGSRPNAPDLAAHVPQLPLPPPPLRRREAREPGLPRTTSVVTPIAAKRMALAKSHPSWEAKAKLRAQMSALPKPLGVKTVFAD